MKARRSEAQKSLVIAAKELAAGGYSVIPVCGDRNPQQPKKPAIAWRRFQREVMNVAEIEMGFRRGVSALGIVCGQVSRLVVIDFDDCVGYQKFCRRFPQWSGTRTVRTRRGFHLYFRTNEKVPSHHFEGGDVKGERSYVVAPPSVIGGSRYVLERSGDPMEVDVEALDEILTHLQAGRRWQRRASGMRVGCGAVDVAALYQRLAPELGRNNALYRSASVARDQGRSQADCENVLAALHVQAVSADGSVEKLSGRWLEARRTIASAYAGGHGYSVEGSGLPNSLREFLLREQGSTVLARLLDIFGIAKWKAGEVFTMADAARLGERYGLNRKSVMEALGGPASVFDGQHIIRRRYVEYLDSVGLNRRGRGRPARILYLAPSVGELMSRFKLGWSPSDGITVDDVKSAHSYRLALHREYIRRLKPRASMSRMAARLGVSRRTIQRYNQELGVSVVEHVGAFELSRQRLGCLPKRRRKHVKNATNGFWLELADGRRYPAWRHVGSWLLKAGVGSVRVCMRGLSGYSLAPVAERRCVSAMDAAEFTARSAARMRSDQGLSLSGAVSAAKAYIGRALEAVRRQVIPLSFDSVGSRIAEDKVAETIRAYLVAEDADGKEVRRPALRGVAYRMLKEFGEGKVFMRVLQGAREALESLDDDGGARHAGLGLAAATG